VKGWERSLAKKAPGARQLGDNFGVCRRVTTNEGGGGKTIEKHAVVSGQQSQKKTLINLGRCAMKVRRETHVHASLGGNRLLIVEIKRETSGTPA